MQKQYHEWVYFVDVKHGDRWPVTILFKEVWMVHKAIAYINEETAEKWKSYIDKNAVNITYHYDENDNMCITQAVLLKKGE